jgi:hypothetical protein
LDLGAFVSAQKGHWDGVSNALLKYHVMMHLGSVLISGSNGEASLVLFGPFDENLILFSRDFTVAEITAETSVAFMCGLLV